MAFKPVVLWTDALVYLLVAVVLIFVWHVRRNPHLLVPWRRVSHSASGMAALTVLMFFIIIGLLDTVHLRPAVGNANGGAGEQAYSVEVLSLLDLIATPLRVHVEKTYSAPFAAHLYARETVELPDGRQTREFPRLKFGGAHLQDPEAQLVTDVASKAVAGGGLGLLVWCLLLALLAAWVARRSGETFMSTLSAISRGATAIPWNAVAIVLLLILLLSGAALALCGNYHILGTDKVGQDVFYQSLKSIRTGLVIGTLTTLMMLPFALLLGITAGYFRGWIDDVIQYLYTTLSSIPGVLLIAAAVLMMQVYIETRPELFDTIAARADLRLLFLCIILGVTSWTGLCRLLRGETLKLREMEYIQAAHAFGVSHWRIISRHILPNVMHIVLITTVMDFSGLVLAEAVLSYVGVGVDPSTISFGTMINAARLEMAREPVVWWALLAAFSFMFALVLSANLFADAVQNAFDPRVRTLSAKIGTLRRKKIGKAPKAKPVSAGIEGPPFLMSAVLQISNLETILHTEATLVRAVDGLTLQVMRGETFALLGESGCGKSMTALSVMRLLPEIGEIVAGSVKLDGEDLLLLPETAMRSIRGKRISMIFQEPMLSLNPVMTVAQQIGEVLRRHFNLRGTAAQKRIYELLNEVGIPDASQRMNEYPFQFSGGMKQRMMIAMALAGEPELLIADEPTTALDVTIQAQVLNLMRDLQQREGMAILLITHDLGVAAEMAHRVGIMYAGEMVETATREDFFREPAHPYSRKLLASLPGRDRRRQGLRLAAISGNVPPLSGEFVGCRFADRCDQAWGLCHDVAPGWTALAGEHHVRCHLFNQNLGSQVNEQGLRDAEPEVLALNSGRADESNIQITSNPESRVSHSCLLSANDLKVYFPIRKGLMKQVVGYVKAVDGVSLEIGLGKTVALVGESGCGKTTVGKGILQLIPLSSGSVRYNGLELVGLERKRLRKLRSEFQLIFQDPYSSLNPRMRIVDIIEEGMNALNVEDDNKANGAKHQPDVAKRNKVDALLESVGLPPEAKWRYPHEFSGGQRQRIAIARALAVNPKLIVCDEPTSALDVSVQAQILNLLNELQDNLGLAYLFITHNISVVEYLADEVAVMYLGRIVERGSVDEVLISPRHPYTQALMSAIPVIELESKRHIIRLHGDLPSPANPPAGCHFHPRCPHVMPICREIYPATSSFSPTHTAHCYLYPQEQDSAAHLESQA